MTHVVVVDDDRSTSKLLAMFLTLDGFEATEVPKPHEVLEQAKILGADAFVIDCHLGTYDGLELVRGIRSDDDLMNTTVVVTSGKYLAQESKAAGANLFLLKPFSPSDLSSKLRDLLAVEPPCTPDSD